jgi:hypothetical protein
LDRVALALIVGTAAQNRLKLRMDAADTSPNAWSRRVGVAASPIKGIRRETAPPLLP